MPAAFSLPQEELDTIAAYAFKVNEVLKKILLDANIRLIDFKLEFGRLADGTIAGSATCLYDCMKRAVLEMGVPLESAVRAASENPARSIGIDNDYGSLSAGRYGNVILADEALNIQAVVQKGTRIV